MNPKKKAGYILCLWIFFNNLVFFAPAAILVRTRCGITLSQFFILQIVLSTAIFLFEVPCGFVTDRIGYKRSFILSQLLLTVTRIIFLIGGNVFVFALEAVIEAISISFMSGTDSAYLYSVYDNSEYMHKSAVLGNYNTAGFILSTVLFVPLNSRYGIQGLIAATLAASSIALLIIVFLPPETDVAPTEQEDTQADEQSVPMRFLIKQLLHKKVLALFVLSALLSIGSFIVNFFYILKLQEQGLNENWISFIILMFSALTLATPFIIKKIQVYEPITVLTCELLLIAAVCFMIYFFTGYAVFAPMLILPVLLALPSFVTGKMCNELVDALQLKGSRAAFLSFFNQGTNILEIVFLFAAALVQVQTTGAIFLFSACSFCLIACITLFLRKTIARVS